MIALFYEMSLKRFITSMVHAEKRQKTLIIKKEETFKKDWILLDASGKTLGRFASEVAKILRINRVNVIKKIKSGQIKAEKIGRNYVVAREEVLKALGLVIGEKSKEEIDQIVKRGVKEYGEVFKKLGKE